MRDLLDLDRYPLHQPGTPAWNTLVEKCRADLAKEGMFDLEGFVRPDAVERTIAEVKPVLDTLSFVHRRAHNVYFRKDVPELPADHPVLAKVETISHTVCADQISNSVPVWIYEWPHFAVFLAACMGKEALFTMRDPLARVNVMGYREGEALNWHFDRSEFTTTILFQAPDEGGEFQYRSNLRSDTDPNYEGVVKALRGEDPEVRTIKLKPGSLNVFKGKNTMHRVTPVKGDKERLIAVYSYYERPGVTFTKEEQMGFYGRAA